jgi:hypothetical protein
MAEDSDKKLEPARPSTDQDERAAFMPRFPWRWVILGVVAIGFLSGSYLWRQHDKTVTLRTRILTSYHGELSPFVERYGAFRDKIEGLVMGVKDDDPPETYADPRLNLSALHQGQGLYLRLSREQAQTPGGIALAAKDLLRDGIGRCLGVAPTSLRGFYESGEFLLPAWPEEVETADLARLEVLEADLSRRVDRDLPSIATAMQAQYLLVIIQQTNRRAEAPSDVYIWDLRDEKLLLSVRTEPVGRMVPVRIALPGVDVPRTPTPDLNDSILATDCAIAAQVKEAAGEPAMGWSSEVPEGDEEGDGDGDGDGDGNGSGDGSGDGDGDGDGSGDGSGDGDGDGDGSGDGDRE